MERLAPALGATLLLGAAVGLAQGLPPREPEVWLLALVGVGGLGSAAAGAALPRTATQILRLVALMLVFRQLYAPWVRHVWTVPQGVLFLLGVSGAPLALWAAWEAEDRVPLAQIAASILGGVALLHVGRAELGWPLFTSAAAPGLLAVAGRARRRAVSLAGPVAALHGGSLGCGVLYGDLPPAAGLLLALMPVALLLPRVHARLPASAGPAAAGVAGLIGLVLALRVPAG